MQRFAQLLSINEKEAELQLCKLINNKSIFAKIDRPNGIITFRKKSTSHNKLDDWRSDLNAIMNKLDQTCHLITKEALKSR